MKKLFAIITFMTFIPTYGHAKRCETIKFKNFAANVGRCDDGTVSFAQPTSYKGKGKKSNYEGLCGAVAAANSFHAYCDNYFVIPEKIGPKYFNDITPGIRPDTLVSGLNKLFKNNRENCLRGKWHHYYTENRWDFISFLSNAVSSGETYWQRTPSENSAAYNSSPVIVLISKNNGDVLHYVTVVDVDMYDRTRDFDDDKYSKECKVIYNDFQSQKSTTCKRFASWARQVNNNTWTSWMNDYNYFKFVQ